MECTLAALIACFSWSGLYLDTGLVYQDRGEQYLWQGMEYYENGGESGTRPVERHYEFNRSPYGRLGIGYEITVGRFTWSAQASHLSSIDTTRDKGVNSIGLNVRWHPFQ